MAAKRFSLRGAQFVKTALLPSQYPCVRGCDGKVLPEIAVAGRSNVGKSSLLNHLLGARGLVKTSSTPGKTQALNFFSVGDSVSFADLPGYGYAKVPEKVRRQWGPMVHTYLQERDPLALILFLLDIRRIPNADDLQFIEWVLSQQRAMILVLTKVDKVSSSQRAANTQKIKKVLQLENLHTVYYSVTKNVGKQQLTGLIREAIADECGSDII